MSSPHRNLIVPLVIACALFMEQIDGSIIATALPRISQSLQTDPVHLNLAITCYMFSLAVFIPLSGWIADRFGARNIFRLAILVFVLGSIACGLSNDLKELVLARVLQGAGGAMMVPVGRLILLRTVPKAYLVDAMAWMVAPAMIGPVLGPPVGGIIVTYASWRWIFFINVPIGILGYLLSTRYIENIRGRKREPLDFLGFVLVALSLSGLMFGFEAVGREVVPIPVICGVVSAGILSFILYLLHMRRITCPIIDLRTLQYQTYRASLTGGSLFRVAIGALPFLLPLLLQYGFGLSPAMSGFTTLASAVGAFTMKIWARSVIRAVGFRRILIANTALSAFFLGGCAFFTRESPLWFIFAFLLVGGFFRSLQFTALNTIAYAEVPEYMLARANTLYTMVQQLSLSLGVAVGALALNLTLGWHGSAALEVRDFWPAFIGVAALCQFAVIAFIPLARDAGAVISGHNLPAHEAEHKDPA